MFRRLFKLLRPRIESAEAPPSPAWYELPNDVAAEGEPYDPAKGLRIRATELNAMGKLSIVLDDLQSAKTSMALSMGFGNGLYQFDQQRVECESKAAYEEFVAIIREAGGFEPCDADESDFTEIPLHRHGYDVYRNCYLDNVCDYTFVNPVPNQAAFALHDDGAMAEEGLPTLPSSATVKELILARIRVAEDVLKQLTDFKELRTLRFIDIAIRNEDLRYLIALQELRTLQLWDTAVTQHGIDHLRAQLPDCEILTNIDEPNQLDGWHC